MEYDLKCADRKIRPENRFRSDSIYLLYANEWKSKMLNFLINTIFIFVWNSYKEIDTEEW